SVERGSFPGGEGIAAAGPFCTGFGDWPGGSRSGGPGFTGASCPHPLTASPHTKANNARVLEGASLNFEVCPDIAAACGCARYMHVTLRILSAPLKVAITNAGPWREQIG